MYCLKLYQIGHGRAVLTSTADFAKFWQIGQNWPCYLAPNTSKTVPVQIGAIKLKKQMKINVWPKFHTCPYLKSSLIKNRYLLKDRC